MLERSLAIFVLASLASSLGCSAPDSQTSTSTSSSSSASGSSSTGSPPPPMHPFSKGELELRHQLGIPDDAERVILLGQNAHLDIDWQKTFDAYYGDFVGDVLIEARQILEDQPRAFYSVAEMAFLKHHLDEHPEEVAPLQEAAARGALHIVGGGVTSPDTLLPEPELLARDFLYGIQFSEDTLGLTPKAAYLPDSFGHSATAPDVLAAAGFTSVAFARIDGAPTLFEQIILRMHDPKPGSNAALLEKLGSADFTWHGAGGAKIFAHYMVGPRLYCQGDNIDFDESLEVAGGHVGPFDDKPAYTDGQIDLYESEIVDYAKTPYLFVPVGCDFAHPKKKLIDYADGYNQRRYPTTHVWAAVAPFDLYAELVSYWSDVLPDVTGDLTPYYTGFYGSRADLKRGTRDAARPFFVAEAFATAAGSDGLAVTTAMRPELELLTRTDHHDFVTGTAADNVVASEQTPLLAAAQQAGVQAANAVGVAIAKRVPLASGAALRFVALNASSATESEVVDFSVPIAAGAPPIFRAVVGGNEVPLEVAKTPAPTDTTAELRAWIDGLPAYSWRVVDLLPMPPSTPASSVSLVLEDASGHPVAPSAATHVEIANTHVKAVWESKQGVFALTSLAIDGSKVLAGRSALVNDYHDTGGLWRLGNEMNGCELKLEAPDASPESVEVLEQSPLVVRVAFKAKTETREAALGAGDAGLSLAITTGAAVKTTRTVTFDLAVSSGAKLETSSPAGSVTRPLERIYDPTFYPAVGWAKVGGWAVLLRQSTGVRMSEVGHVELMAARDARTEMCDVEGGTGSDKGKHRIEWRIVAVGSAADAERAAQAFDRPVDVEIVGLDQAATLDLAASSSLFGVTGGGVVSAFKPADRGEGFILRALLMPGPVHVSLPPALAAMRATVVDLAERDGKDLGPAGATLTLDAASFGAIATVRLSPP